MIGSSFILFASVFAVREVDDKALSRVLDGIDEGDLSGLNRGGITETMVQLGVFRTGGYGFSTDEINLCSNERDYKDKLCVHVKIDKFPKVKERIERFGGEVDLVNVREDLFLLFFRMFCPGQARIWLFLRKLTRQVSS